MRPYLKGIWTSGAELLENLQQLASRARRGIIPRTSSTGAFEVRNSRHRTDWNKPSVQLAFPQTIYTSRRNGIIISALAQCAGQKRDQQWLAGATGPGSDAGSLSA